MSKLPEFVERLLTPKYECQERRDKLAFLRAVLRECNLEPLPHEADADATNVVDLLRWAESDEEPSDAT